MINLCKIILFIILFSCSAKEPVYWSVEHIETGGKFDSSRLICSSAEKMNNLDIEIITQNHQRKIYLNTTSGKLIFDKDTQKSLGSILINNEKQNFEAFCYAGAQKVLLPDYISSKIIESLKNNKEVQINFPGFKTTLKPKGFSGKLSQAEKPKKSLPIILKII